MDGPLRRLVGAGDNLGKNTCGGHSVVTVQMMDPWLHHWTLDPDISLEAGNQRQAFPLPLEGTVSCLAPCVILTPRPWGPMLIICGSEFRSLPIARGMEQ